MFLVTCDVRAIWLLPSQPTLLVRFTTYAEESRTDCSGPAVPRPSATPRDVILLSARVVFVFCSHTRPATVLLVPEIVQTDQDWSLVDACGAEGRCVNSGEVSTSLGASMCCTTKGTA